MSLGRELRDLVALIRAPAADKAITFYAESAGYHAYFADLIEALTDGHALTVTYLTSDPEDPVLAAGDPRVRSYYLRALLPFYLALCRARVLVLTVMDLHTGPLRRSINAVHHAYVFHGLGSTHRACRERAFDHYDSIHCVGPHHVSEIRRREELAGLSPKELVAAGYPRLDRIRRARARATQRDPQAPTRVLVAPSWHADNLLAHCGPELLDALVGAGHEVVLRVHPEMLRRQPKDVAQLERRFRDRVTVERSVRSDDSLLWADVLVTDGSMIALEFAFGVARPVVFVDTPPKVRNPGWRELGLEPLEEHLRGSLGAVVAPQHAGEVPATVARLTRDPARWASALEALARQHVYQLDRAAEVGARHLVERAGLQGAASTRRPGPEPEVVRA